MSDATPERVLVHAPHRRNAAMMCQFLTRSGIAATGYSGVQELCCAIGEGTGAALISDESLSRTNVTALAEVLHQQPAWSDLPVVVTTSGGEATEASRRGLSILEPLGNVTLLERPLRA